MMLPCYHFSAMSVGALLLLSLGGGLQLSASLLYTFRYIPSASEPEIPSFTFSVTLPNYVTTDGGFSISPIIDPEGFDLIQADFENYGSFIDMRFGTANDTFTRTTTGETPPRSSMTLLFSRSTAIRKRLEPPSRPMSQSFQTSVLPTGTMEPDRTLSVEFRSRDLGRCSWQV
jgi:hypothetical protein